MRNSCCERSYSGMACFSPNRLASSLGALDGDRSVNFVVNVPVCVVGDASRRGVAMLRTIGMSNTARMKDLANVALELRGARVLLSLAGLEGIVNQLDRGRPRRIQFD